MNRDEITRLLWEGQELEFDWPDFALPHTGSLKRCFSLIQLAADSPDLYPARALQEMPHYVFEQQMARSKPFKLVFSNYVTDSQVDPLESWFSLDFYFASLDEVDQFLSQLDITVCDFRPEPF